MSYTQLKKSDRVVIEILLEEGRNFRTIAQRLGRNVGTISREISRNQNKHSGQYRSHQSTQ